MGMEKITSTANPQVRQLIQLQKKARLRKEEDVYKRQADYGTDVAVWF